MLKFEEMETLIVDVNYIVNRYFRHLNVTRIANRKMIRDSYLFLDYLFTSSVLNKRCLLRGCKKTLL